VKIKLTVKYDDGKTADVTAKGVDFIDFERKYDRGITSVFGDGMRLEYLWYLAHAALCRKNGETRPFDEWAATVEAVESEEAETSPSSQPDPSPSS
jgi:hypothetical protein